MSHVATVKHRFTSLEALKDEMRLVSEHVTRDENDRRDRWRAVRIYTGGIREVSHGNAEYWNRYIIIPRRLILNEIRKLRAKGCSIIGSWNFWELLPEGASELIGYAGNSGPGGSFVREPCKIRSARKFVVIYQSGGLDI